MKRSQLSMSFTRVAPLGRDRIALAGHLYAFGDERATRTRKSTTRKKPRAKRKTPAR